MENLYVYEYKSEASLNKHFNKLIKYAGKKRVNKLISIYIQNNNITAAKMISIYEKNSTDFWEMDTFFERITNNGFQRYNSNAVVFFAQEIINVVRSAKKLNLI
tara:strand:+ start:2006 stop:2317 length:312 start_codon:yes stop_codon:yes gene_type:complete